MGGLDLASAFATIVVGGALVAAGAVKLARGAPAVEGGVWPARALAGVEITVGLGVWSLWWPARIAAAGLLCAFAAWHVRALRRGHAGTPCPCFGGLTQVGPGGAVAGVALAFGAVLVAAGPAPRLALAAWLGVVAAVLAGSLGLVSAVAYVLARDVARLRARGAPPGALEIGAEGPPRGRPSPLISRFEAAEGELALAVFVSPGCGLCAELEPAVAAFARRPGVNVAVLDEERDAPAWRAASVPGSPYAIALRADGVVLAKGTFNTAEQLESVAGTALWRQAGELVCD